LANWGESRTVELVVVGPLDPAAVADWCGRLELLIGEHDADLVVCDVGAIERGDVEVVDALARLQLTARRLGSAIRLRNASTQLRELLAWSGLGEVLPGVALSVGLRGQVEEREQLGVEEERELTDPGT
jgi:ABC-type transporter Mla MlaB component